MIGEIMVVVTITLENMDLEPVTTMILIIEMSVGITVKTSTIDLSMDSLDIETMAIVATIDSLRTGEIHLPFLKTKSKTLPY